MEYRYSVIIPIYNAEKTLKRCISSLVRQNYPGVQVILVNDGSTDLSDSICRHYAREYADITYIYQENKGVACARNRGIEAAEGEWILFVDSDDYVTKNYFKVIDKRLREKPCDLLVFSHYTEKDSQIRGMKQSFFYTNDEDEARKKVVEMICRKTINAPWGKAYRRKLITEHHVTFTEEVSIAEDRAFNIKYALNIASLCLTADHLYVLTLDNTNSLSRRRNEKQDLEFSLAARDIQDAISKSALDESGRRAFYQAISFGTYRSVYRMAKEMVRDGIDRCERIRQLKQKCKDMDRKGLDYPDILYCHLVMMPIKLGLVSMIDAMGCLLSR